MLYLVKIQVKIPPFVSPSLHFDHGARAIQSSARGSREMMTKVKVSPSLIFAASTWSDGDLWSKRGPKGNPNHDRWWPISINQLWILMDTVGYQCLLKWSHDGHHFNRGFWSKNEFVTTNIYQLYIIRLPGPTFRPCFSCSPEADNKWSLQIFEHRTRGEHHSRYMIHFKDLR